MEESGSSEIGGHVLIVDDDTILRGIAHETLQQAGLLVSEAEDGVCALKAVETIQPDIILMDVMMPNMDGFEATAALRQLAEFQSVPIVIMTALDDMASINRAYEVGVTDFITKPINWVILVQRVRYILRSMRVVEQQRKLQSKMQQMQKLEVVSTLAGGLAHDFNNILQTIQGVSELLKASHAPTPAAESEIDRIIVAVDRGSALTRQMLSYSRRLTSEKQVINLNARVLEMHQLLVRAIPKMVAIELELDADIGMVNADSAQIEQVLMNLALNARDAMPNGGTLTISTARVAATSSSGDAVLLSLSDTGHGMDQQTRESIFEPFFSTKAPGKGTGLGLSMVQSIIRNHDGDINCTSQMGSGTCFDIELPVVLGVATQQTPDTTSVENLAGSETILLVDDDETQRESLRRRLADEGYRVLTASEGEGALEICAASDVDLVVLDIMMPGMGGVSCLQKIGDLWPGIKVLMASGYSPNDEAKQTIDKYASGFIQKPFSGEHLLGTIRNTFDRC